MASRVSPVPKEHLVAEYEEVRQFFEAREESAGYVATALLIMGRRPNILRKFVELLQAINWDESLVSGELKTLVALMRSHAGGCMYCQAHTATRAATSGVSPAKLDALWTFESSPLFTAAERAALRLARDAAVSPNAVTDEHFEELRPHFSEDAVVELMAVISIFAFLNCWNDSLATTLEDVPVDVASERLAGAGWQVGRHAHSGPAM